MRILSMTATFGKLQNQTLTLEPGLNIIHAPNEWGKSTWCAFLINMLYGVDTRQRSTATVLADKDRYAPWSGQSMAGSIRLLWQDRDITIERSSTPRIPLGNFRAFETETGIEIPELTAANCGQMLLGVERNVFTRAGFIRHADLPVTQDDALRRRLNALVTTGDDSGTADNLEERLRDLKNKCRFNNKGLLPQLESEQTMLRRNLEKMNELSYALGRYQKEREGLENQASKLENHLTSLDFEAYRQAQARSAHQAQALADATERLSQLKRACAQLESAEQLRQKLENLEQLGERQNRLDLERSLLPSAPPAPEQKLAVSEEQARRDYAALEGLKKKQKSANTLGLIGTVVGLLLLILAPVTSQYLSFGIPGLAALAFGIVCLVSGRQSSAISALCAPYRPLPPQEWIPAAVRDAEAQRLHAASVMDLTERRADLDRRQAALEESLQALTGALTGQACRTQWEFALEQYRLLEQTQKELAQLERAGALPLPEAPVSPPEQPDDLTLNRPDTQRQLEDTRASLRQLQLQIGQCQGQMEVLGDEHVLRSRLDTLNRRISQLEEYQSALELALDSLFKARTTLQRRFAPMLVKRAQAYFQHLTGGRYEKLSMAEDMTLRTAAQEEITLQTAQWRSDGTIDQLYLALRLAVAAELTPLAPLVLDDALVRFDDDRLKLALTLLKETSQEKQVIVFTCHNREENC